MTAAHRDHVTAPPPGACTDCYPTTRAANDEALRRRTRAAISAGGRVPQWNAYPCTTCGGARITRAPRRRTHRT